MSEPMQVNQTARWQASSRPIDDAVRVWIVVDLHRGGRVHGVTCDLDEAQRWIGILLAQYENDPLCATLTVGLVYPDGAS